MDDTIIATRLESLDQRVESLDQRVEKLDHRVERIEQFLPTLATKDELRRAIDEAVAPLATKEFVGESVAELRRHMDILFEDQRGDIRLIAEHLAALMSDGHRP